MGGADEARNQQIATLKNLFYTEKGPETNGAEIRLDDSITGIYEDMPLCRWRYTFLPAFQTVLNVWQPQYTHMFEGIIAGPKPWLYVHLQLPGGTENLGKPEYDLKIGTQAPMVGTLMRVVSAQRSEDSRLILVVQGISRVRVLEATQMLPYSRANVQLLPDFEQLEAYQQSASRMLEAADPQDQFGELDLGVPRLNDQPEWCRTVALAGAVAEERQWEVYEAAHPVEQINNMSPLVPFNFSVEALCSKKASLHADKAIHAAATQAVVVRDTTKTLVRDASDISSNGNQLSPPPAISPVLSRQDLVSAGLLVDAGRTELGRIGKERCSTGATLEDVEIAVWKELDRLLAMAARDYDRPSLPIPSSLLSLLPPPPRDGWEEPFFLGKVAAQLESTDGSAAAQGFERVGMYYPSRRRAARLSWTVCALLGGGGPLQTVLEAQGTRDRLEIVLGWLIALRKAADKGGEGEK